MKKEGFVIRGEEFQKGVRKKKRKKERRRRIKGGDGGWRGRWGAGGCSGGGGDIIFALFIASSVKYRPVTVNIVIYCRRETVGLFLPLLSWAGFVIVSITIASEQSAAIVFHRLHPSRNVMYFFFF